MGLSVGARRAGRPIRTRPGIHRLIGIKFGTGLPMIIKPQFINEGVVADAR
jgi:hypothetical protein